MVRYFISMRASVVYEVQGNSVKHFDTHFPDDGWVDSTVLAGDVVVSPHVTETSREYAEKFINEGITY